MLVPKQVLRMVTSRCFQRADVFAPNKFRPYRGCSTTSGGDDDKKEGRRFQFPGLIKLNFPLTSNAHDLKRFLEEIGTDPAETKYWLRQFQRSAEDADGLFAVLQIDKQVLQKSDLLKCLGSNIAFLHRINLPCVVIHGFTSKQLGDKSLTEVRSELLQDTLLLTSLFESHGAPTRPLFAGSGVIESSEIPVHCSSSHVVRVQPDAVHWALDSGHLPVIQAIGETPAGQLLNVPLEDVTGFLAPALKPRKVLVVGQSGGLRDERGEVIATINVPRDIQWIEVMPWCTKDVKTQITNISDLLTSLPIQSSVVLTSPRTLLTELFTHNGSGTLFKNTEGIRTYKSLDDIDTVRLLDVINRTFGRELKEDYLKQLSEKLGTLYLSEEYNAVAIVTKELVNVPYLDKFAVSKAGQGEGLCQMLWDSIRRDYPCLFWRSRHSNKISSWYFKKCEGSWTDGKWIVFWYGVPSHKKSSILTDYALTLDDSFATTIKDYKPSWTQ